MDKIQFKSNEVKDEMLDHYCTAYEQLLNDGVNKSKALDIIKQKIETEDFKNLKNKFNMKSIIILIPLGLIFLVMTNNHAFSDINQNPISQSCIDSQNEFQADYDPPFGSPLKYTKISSEFGERIHPIHKKTVFHKGVDLLAPSGTSVIAVETGEVTDAGYDNKYGYFIEIKHDEIYSTRYHHLKSIDVSKGELISKNQKIGEVGSTGLSTGPHLHYEIIKSGKWVDVAKYLKA